MKPEVILLARLLVLVFMSILFLQSGSDKLLNYRSNYDWLHGYFSKSIFKSQVKVLFPALTLLELASGMICLTGVFKTQNVVNPMGFYGLFLCAITMLCLFAGQRIAKDYAGAAGMPAYFIVCLIGLLTYMI
jgi:uncharacterized membrane protein YphA (DoxX/SURF4 family)